MSLSLEKKVKDTERQRWTASVSGTRRYKDRNEIKVQRKTKTHDATKL